MGTFIKKVASAVSIVALTATTFGTSVASAASEFLPYAEQLAAKSVINTQSSESGYRLSDNITRAEISKIAANLGSYEMSACDSNLYTDVNSSFGDLCDAITTLANAGVVSTSYSMFRPNDLVTRGEMVKILLGALGETASSTSAGYTDVTSDLGDLAGYINRANELGCAASAMYFRPNASSSRGEAFKIAACAAKIDPTPVDPKPTDEDQDNTDTDNTDTTTTTTSDELTVSLVGEAVAQYVPKNASSVNVGTIRITAGEDDVSFRTVTINRSGLGDSDGMTIALGQNGVSVSNDQSVSSSTQKAVVRLNNAVSLKAGESVDFQVLVNLPTGDDATANSQHQFSVVAVGDDDDFEAVTLGLLNTTSYEVSTVTVSDLDLEDTIDSGESDQKIGEITFDAGDRDVTLNGFVISQESGDPDLDEAFADVEIYKDGTKIADATVTDDKIIVTGLDLKIESGDDVDLQIRADIIYVGDQEKIKLSIDDTTDVSATEDDTGYTTSVTIDSSAQNQETTLEALTLNWTDETTKDETVSPGTSSVTLFDAKLSSSTDFEVTAFEVVFKTGSTSYITDLDDYFKKVRLTVAGTTYDLDDIEDKLSGSKFVFSKSSDSFYLSDGQKVTVKITATIDDDVATGTDIDTEVTITEVENVSTGKSSTPNDDDSDSDGPTITVKAPTLTIDDSTVSAPDEDKIYTDADSLEIGRFSLEAEAEDITVNDLTITNSGTVTDLTEILGDASDIKLVKVSDGSTVAKADSVTATKIVFDDIDETISQDTTINFKILVDTEDDFGSQSGTVILYLAAANVDADADTTVSVEDSVKMETYTVSFVPPVITLTKSSDDVFIINFKNTDDDSYIDINSVDIQIKADSDDADYSGIFCLRPRGSSATCTDATYSNTGTVANSSPETITLTSGNLIRVSSDNNKDYEIYIQSGYNNPDDLTAKISEVNYTPEGGSATDASYSVSAN